ncbi:MAG: hypothetical protein JW878_10805 [Methanomicrobia archaeon]|nr:hypothetical protein [Methanomicrobia archaeon]
MKKVILSRKGFDSSAGGYPSPILPDGRLISLPIPVVKGSRKYDPDAPKYSNLVFNGNMTYLDLLRKLRLTRLKGANELNCKCHPDPDIYKNLRERPKNLRGAFGQIEIAQKHLENQNVGKDDIFLFFGRFRKIDEDFAYIGEDLHVIFGYLQIEEKILVQKDTKVPDWLESHPHCTTKRRGCYNNTVYISKDRLSFNNSLPGYGVLNYNENLVLTKRGHRKSQWNLPPFFKNLISYHSEKSWKNGYFQSAGRGQEFVIQCNKKIENWVKDILKKD